MLLHILIGFWYHKKKTAHTAAMKAFVVNRVGDFGFVLGIIAIFALTGSVSFDAIFASVVQLSGCNGQHFWLAVASIRSGLCSFIYRCNGEISTIRPSHLAAGCYGRAYPCICAHPCCNHGDGRCVFGMPNVAGHRICTYCAGDHNNCRRIYGNFCSDGWVDPV